MAIVHIIGLGLSGLAAATALAARGWSGGEPKRLRLYEAAGHAGGRARTFHEPALGRDIDNGNHLMLGANPALFAYLERLGASDGLCAVPGGGFPFVDLSAHSRWMVRPNNGPLPWWVFVPSRRVAGASALDHLAGFRLMMAKPHQSVADCLDQSKPVYRNLFEPLTVGVMNAAPREASAQVMANVLREVFAGGAATMQPYIAREGLSPALVAPALAYLSSRGIEPEFGSRLRMLERDVDGRPTDLRFADRTIPIGPGDRVILALPPNIVSQLLPELKVPSGSRAIVNAHFRLDTPPVRGSVTEPVALVGLVGSTSQWLFFRDDIVSVTVSAADQLAELDADEIARLLWAEVAHALRLMGAGDYLSQPMPAARIVKEKRATFLQTPENQKFRPDTLYKGGLVLAGDWTNTGLPATIEGSIRSGEAAAALIAPK